MLVSYHQTYQRYLTQLCSLFQYFQGKLVATGSEDSSIKIIDVNRMLAKAEETEESEAGKTMKEQLETHPVIRTLYDHAGVSM